MTVQRFNDRPLPGEHLLALDPDARAVAGGDWRRRPRLFAGRSVSHETLDERQASLTRRQRLLTRAVSPGVVRGLDVTILREERGDMVEIDPGFGLCWSGEDIAAPRRSRFAFDKLPVVTSTAATGDAATGFEALARTPGAEHLRPPRLRRVGAALGAVKDGLSDPAARVMILLAQPVEAIGRERVAEEEGDPTLFRPDRRDEPFMDVSLTDGVRLILFPWPADVLTDPASPPVSAAAGVAWPDYALPDAAGEGLRFRNRLARAIFSVERGFPAGGAHPWEQFGLPLGVVLFDEQWRVAGFDRAAVARQGGLPRQRSQLVAQSGGPALWQARIDQFADHLAELRAAGEKPADLARHFARLPPVGLLPAAVLSLGAKRWQSFFPTGFTVTVFPAPREQLPVLVREAASLQPIDMDEGGGVDLIVPVPERDYDPALFVEARPDEGFPARITELKASRGVWIARLGLARRRLDALTFALSAVPLSHAPPSAAETSAPPGLERAAATPAATVTLIPPAVAPPLSEGDAISLWIRFASAEVGDIEVRAQLERRSETEAGAVKVEGSDVASVVMKPDGKGRTGPQPAAGWQRLVAPAEAFKALLGKQGRLHLGAVTVSSAVPVTLGPVSRVAPDGNETVLVADPAGSDKAAPTADRLPLPEEADYGTAQGQVGREVARQAGLRRRLAESAWLPEPLRGGSILDRQGVDRLIATLQARVRMANDVADNGFLRARADITRIRQMMLGDSAASRFVTSPAISDIVKRDLGVSATNAALSRFLQEASGKLREAKLAGATSTASTSTASTSATAPSPPPAAGPLSSDLNVRGRTLGAALPRSTLGAGPTLSGGLRGVLFGGSGVVTGPQATPSGLREAIALTEAPRVGEPVAVRLPLVREIGIDARAAGVVDARVTTPPSAVVDRDVTVGERLPDSDGRRAWSFAGDGYVEALARLAELDAQGFPVADLALPGTAAATPPKLADAWTKPPAGAARSVDRAFFDRTILRGVEAMAKADEPSLFGEAVRLCDNVIALMRLVEQRIDQWEALIAEASRARDDIAAARAACAARLVEIETELAECRQDIAIAEALMAEDARLVAETNARRAAVLAAVREVVFRRPRLVNRVRAVDVETVEPAADAAPAQRCLNDHSATPPELKRFVDRLREAPLAWFPQLRDLMALFDRPADLARVIETANLRALAPLVAAPPMLAGPAKALAMVGRIAALADIDFARRRADRSLPAPDVVRVLGHRAAAESFRRAARLGDLIEGGHGKPAAAARAMAEIEELAELATCLSASFGTVEPALRMRWTELVSEFDEPVALDRLTALPGWPGLPAALRRVQQGLADAIHARFVADEPGAAAFASNLVRVALLIAAHAPVDRIVQGEVATPTQVQPQAIVPLRISPDAARIGMEAQLRARNGELVARAVIADLKDGVAEARIVAALKPGVMLDAMARVELVTLPAAAVRRAMPVSGIRR